MPRFTRLDNQVRPKDHIDILRSLLRDRYSPLQPNGNGLQSIHLTELPQPFAETLIALIGGEADLPLVRAADQLPTAADDLDSWESQSELVVAGDVTLPGTERLAIVSARRGQGLFRERVELGLPAHPSTTFRSGCVMAWTG
jgi:putative restriction endonuclease